MWSQCAWLKKMSPLTGDPFARAISDRPSSRMPVPASSTMSQSSAVRNSRHGVLPPYRTVELPGVGIDPRVPQKRTCSVIVRAPTPFS